MDGFEFENCGNAVLKCEGKILGGVEKGKPVQERTPSRKLRNFSMTSPLKGLFQMNGNLPL